MKTLAVILSVLLCLPAFAQNVKITALPATTGAAAGSSDVFPVVHGGVTSKMTLYDILNLPPWASFNAATCSALSSVPAQCGGGQFSTGIGANGNANCASLPGSSAVTSVTASSPLHSSGGTTPNLTCQTASSSQAGCVAQADWLTFNGKQDAVAFVNSVQLAFGDVSLVGDTGSPPASSYYGTDSFGALGYHAVPSGAGSGSVTNVAVASANGFAGTVANPTSTPTISLTTTISGILKGSAGAIVAAVAADIPSLASLYCSLTGCTMTGAITMGSNQIHTVTDPTSPQDAATKNYVDSVATGIQPIQAVYAATIGSNIAGTYSNGAAGVGATFTTTSTATFILDGTTPPVSNSTRILFKDQTSGFQNGVYTFTTGPVGGVSGSVFTRATDYNTASEMNAGNLIPVLNGTVNESGGVPSLWIQTATITTVGTDSLVFAQFKTSAGGTGAPTIQIESGNYNVLIGDDEIWQETTGTFTIPECTGLANNKSWYILNDGVGVTNIVLTSPDVYAATAGGGNIFQLTDPASWVKITCSTASGTVRVYQ